MDLRIYNGTEADDSVQAPQAETAVPDEHLLGQFIPLHYHYNMLQDQARVGAFRQAIEIAVKPGMRVLELGGGTGILSALAARCGARVCCVERNPHLARTARRLVDQNGLADRIDVVEMDALAYLPNEPVDVVICEMLHVAMLREKQLAVIESFKRRYRRAFGARLPRFLPEASVLLVQPVDQCFDFSGFWAPIPLFQAPAPHVEGTRELAGLRAYATIDYDQPFASDFSWSQAFEIDRPGRVTAVRFATQNVVAIDVAQQHAVTWPNQCMVLPLEKPVDVTVGDKLEIGFEYSAGGSIDDIADSLIVRLRGAAVRRAA